MVKVTYTDVQLPLIDIYAAIQQKSFFPNGPTPLVVGDPDSELSVLKSNC